jgi:hypothetical protein
MGATRRSQLKILKKFQNTKFTNQIEKWGLHDGIRPGSLQNNNNKQVKLRKP